MHSTWQLAEKYPPEFAERFSNLEPLSIQLLYNRGITDPARAEKFLNQKYEEGLNSPFLFLDMAKAAERIWQAVEQGEKICVYGDYDADAVTANAVLRQTFRYLGVEVTSYIPDRFTEGYGVNLDALQKIKDDGAKLIITVDCGTNSAEAANFCLENNIDLIITDHHELVGELPKAYAIINPKNPNDTYPDQNITGVGVAFKLACGILNKLKVKSEKLKVVAGWEKWLLDLVAIGTVADCHSLLGENRTLVKYGLKVLQKTRWVGLRALMQSSDVLQEDGLLKEKAVFSKTPDTYTLGFIIAPRLNAAGRLEHANIALDLLMEQDAGLSAQKAGELEKINARRQQLTEMVLSEAREQAEIVKDRKVICLVKNDWPKGVVGLVAGRIAEQFMRPTIVLSLENGQATGSARTVGEFNIFNALKSASGHLVKFGGHKQAAGLTLAAENFEKFYQNILEHAEANLNEQDLVKKLFLETELRSEDLQLTTYNLLANFEPFGVDNSKPKFLLKDAKIFSLRFVGSAGQHLQMNLSVGRKPIAGIWFNASAFARSLKLGDNVDIACELMEDGWNGRKEVKLRVADVKMSKN